MGYLKVMERLAVVEQQKTFLTKEGLGETIDATECSLGCPADDAFWQARQLGGRLQPNPLVRKFTFVKAKKLQEQCLIVVVQVRNAKQMSHGTLTLTDRLDDFLFFFASFFNSSSSTSE